MSSGKLVDISCPVAGYCQAADNSGGVLAYTGSNWSSPVQVDGNNAFVAISCGAVDTCTAADTNDNILYYSPSS